MRWKTWTAAYLLFVPQIYIDNIVALGQTSVILTHLALSFLNFISFRRVGNSIFCLHLAKWILNVICCQSWFQSIPSNANLLARNEMVNFLNATSSRAIKPETFNEIWEISCSITFRVCCLSFILWTVLLWLIYFPAGLDLLDKKLCFRRVLMLFCLLAKKRHYSELARVSA